MRPSRCPSGKIGYPTKGEADAALRRIAARPDVAAGGRHRECRAYLCPMCGEWHTTHKRPPRGQAKRARKRERDARRGLEG